MTDTLRRPSYGGVGVALGPGRPISRTAPPHPRRLLQPVERRAPVAAPRRPFRVRIFCNGDRYFKVRYNDVTLRRDHVERGAMASPKMSQKYILNKKLRHFLFFCPEPCSGGLQRIFRGQECPPSRRVAPCKTNSWLYLCTAAVALVTFWHANGHQCLWP